MAKTAVKSKINFDFTYSENCPSCNTQLGFSLDEGGIVCESGHRFDSMPGKPEEQAQKPLIGQLLPPVEAETTPSRTNAQEARQDELRDRARHGSRFDTPGIKTIAPAPRGGLVEVSVLDPTPSGDAGFRLILRERHLTAIKAEAEIQRQTPENYLQEWLETALDNQWGR